MEQKQDLAFQRESQIDKERALQIEMSRGKIRELQQILGRIASLKNGRGGDVFFKSLAKTFQANPVIPPMHYFMPHGDPDRWHDAPPESGRHHSNPSSTSPLTTRPQATPQRFIVKTKLAGSAGGGYHQSSARKDR